VISLNELCRPIIPNEGVNGEPEYRSDLLRNNGQILISSAGTRNREAKTGLLPRGSALITDSGKLKEASPIFKITHIIHAASGSDSKNDS